MQPARVMVADNYKFNNKIIRNVLVWERGIIRGGIIPAYKTIKTNFVFTGGIIYDVDWSEGYIDTRNAKIEGGLFNKVNVGQDVVWNGGVFIDGSFFGKWNGGIFKGSEFNGEWYKGTFKAEKKGKRIFNGKFYKGTFGDVDNSIFTIFNEKVAKWYGGNWAGGYDSKGNFHETFDTPDKWGVK
jgi:hypothetical protein